MNNKIYPNRLSETEESKDKRIRKAIIKHITLSTISTEGIVCDGVRTKDMLAWLERQKPTWSEEDINMIDWLIRCCEEEHKELCNDKYGHQDIVSDLKRDCRKKWDWLESLKNKVIPQNTWKSSDKAKEVKEKLLLQKAVSVYGTIAQTDMAIEEMGELIVAINHYRRGRIEMDAVKEEIADVMIAMKQLAMIYGESGVEIFSEKKMQRLEQRLKDK